MSFNGNRSLRERPQPEPVERGQNWSAYNAAQTQELLLFDELLLDLLEAIEEPPRKPGPGRPPLPLREALYCTIRKVASMLSCRRAHSIYQIAENDRKITKAPHFNATSDLLNKESLTPILQYLITSSALPLAAVECDFAIDSTGFRTTSFGAYCHSKHRTRNRQEHQWLKAHICSGVKTNIVTRIIITLGNAGDSPRFEPLIRETAEAGFTIRNVSADKAYSSRKNHDVVEELGGWPYIPFKNCVYHNARGSQAWKRAYHYFQLFPDEFKAHYHKRSNVETTIGAIKQKFGETIKSKKPTAQINELLCKVLAYNITVFIHEIQHLGINPTYLT